MKIKAILKNTKRAITVIVGLSLLLAFSQCKRDKEDDENFDLACDASEYINNNLQSQLDLLSDKTTPKAMAALAEWIKGQEGIASAVAFNDRVEYVYVDGTKGSVMVYNQPDEDDLEYSSCSLMPTVNKLQHGNVVGNQRGFIYDAFPYLSKKCNPGDTIQKRFEERGFEYAHPRAEECTIDTLKAMFQYGYVQFVTHGYSDVFATGEKVTRRKRELYRESMDNDLIREANLVIKEGWFGFEHKDDFFAVTNKYIEGLQDEFDNTIVFMGACLGFPEENALLKDAFLHRHAATYFGFNNEVTPPITCFNSEWIVLMLFEGLSVGEAYNTIYNSEVGNGNCFDFKNEGETITTCLNMDGSCDIVWYDNPNAPIVTTSEVTSFTSSMATCGGEVVSDGGTAVTERGVCWSTNHNPTLNDNHGSAGAGVGSFVVNATGLAPSTTYYVRAYATNASGTAYGNEVSFTTNSEYLLTIQTLPVGNITATSAMFRGVITEGEFITRGFCYGTSPNVTVGGAGCQQINVSGNYLGQYEYTCEGLSPSMPYYVKAFALVSTNPLEFVYGDEVSFTTLNTGGDHEYVDLGLPSGLLWATCNVGTTTPEGYGDYFAWGETQPKDIYNRDTYQYYDGGNLTKYTRSDGLTILLPEDDAATANWGNGWRMPTKEEWEELYQNTTSTWTTQNGVNGRLFTGPNGNSLFLPAAGGRWDDGLYDVGSLGYYWSSTLYTDGPYIAWNFYFYSDDYDMGNGYDRYDGLSVRAVRSARQN